MTEMFSNRMAGIPRSFIREILKTAQETDIISFAGGLPDSNLFPADELVIATNKAFETSGRNIFQYAASEGCEQLRSYLADFCRNRKGVAVKKENILITNGSQQALDLLGKVFLNEGDDVVIEEPGYLGVIQALSMYMPEFHPVPVSNEGMDADRLKILINKRHPKLLYVNPNFQNPSGITYSDNNRKEIAGLINSKETFLIEDDPYGELRFRGNDKLSFKKLLPERTVLLGSFSKSIVPGFRLGWMAAPEEVVEKLVIAKQASDLHTSHFTQKIIYQYLKNNDMDKHIQKITKVYAQKCQKMIECIKKYFPMSVSYTIPEGGMFIWVQLPVSLKVIELFEEAYKNKVIFIPGDPFYLKRKYINTFRLNFTCVTEDEIETGIRKIGKAINNLINFEKEERDERSFNFNGSVQFGDR